MGLKLARRKQFWHLGMALYKNLGMAKEDMAMKSIQLIKHPLHSSSFAWAYFFSLPNVKFNLADYPLDGRTSQYMLDGVLKIVGNSDLAKAFQK